MDIDVPLVLRRAAAALVVVLVVPLVVMLGALADEAPIVAGQESPRTIVADRLVRVEDDAATEQARTAARESVQPVENFDLEAQQQIVDDVQEVFESVRAVREPVDIEVAPTPSPSAPDASADAPPAPAPTTSPSPPSRETQLELLDAEIDAIDQEGLQELVGLSDAQLARLEQDVIDVVQALAVQRIRSGEVEAVLEQQLPSELAVTLWPGDTAQTVVEPLVRSVLRPTVLIDEEETQRLRDQAAAAVEPVVEQWQEGETVVEAGEIVSPVELQALEDLGQAGSEPGVAFIRGLLAMILVVTVFALYLRRGQPAIWADPARLFVLAVTTVIASVLLYAVKVLAGEFGPGFWFAFPVGGLALLLSVLTTPQVGTVAVLPLAALGLLLAPSVPSVVIFITTVVVLAAPMTARISTRVGLRRANVRVALAAPVIAVVVAVVFGPREQEQLLIVALAAAIGSVANAGLLQGLLPAFESTFKLATVTALLDLADRNHPLLRELEQKAMGSYNHSVMVASLAERCCREIGASHLLGQVAGLYHDIGKVRQPVFFIENQRGIANPHDQLTPRMSAVIIQNHVVDGVEMATEHRLPPDVVDCIGSHHGTMKVGYFYRRAVEAAGGDESKVDEEHFRYKGHKPRSKEAGVLLLSDCTEAATRAMAMNRGTLPTDVIESTVDKLLRERVDDGQFDDCELTFVELQTVRDTLVDALTGIYHPRIGYPGGQPPPSDDE